MVTTMLNILSYALSRFLKLLVRISLLVIFEKGTNHVFHIIAYFFLSENSDEPVHSAKLTDIIRYCASKLIVRFNAI